MLNFIVGVITNFQSLNPVHTGQPVVQVVDILMLNEFLWYKSSLRLYFEYGMRCIVSYCLPSRTTTCKGTLNVVKVRYKLNVASGPNLPWFGSME